MVDYKDRCHTCNKLARMTIVYRRENGTLVENGHRCVEHGTNLINSLVSGDAHKRGDSFVRVTERVY